MRESVFTFPTSDGLNVHVYRWSGDAEPKAVVQVAHGIGEHALRYKRLAGALVDHGYEVYADDQRGHGRTATGPEQHGHFGTDGWNRFVDDIGQLGEIAHREHPQLPLVLFAHSLGSFAAQQLILDHSDRVDALVLSGTTAVDLLASTMDPAQPSDMSALNAAFQPARTPFDWLSRDEAEVDAYMADPLCGFGMDALATADFIAAAPQTGDPARLANIRKDLPVYVMAGDADPLNAGLALLKVVEGRYRGVGLQDLTVRIYPGGRHELLNETNREEVMAELIAWLDRVVA